MFAGTLWRWRRWIIGLGIVAGLVASYAALGFFAVPYFARSNLISFVNTHYHRPVAIGDIRFNPFTFTLDAKEFSLPDADGQPMLAFGRLYVDLEVRSVWRLAPSFHEIILERPFVRTLIRPDGSVNLADLGKGFASKPAPPAKGPQEPMSLFIDRLSVRGGTGIFEDRTRPTPFQAELKPIAFELRNFSTRAKTDNAYVLTAASPEGERLNWNGTLRLEPLSSRGTFEITNLLATTVWTYLQAPLPIDISKGVIGVKGGYAVESAGGPLGLQVNVDETTVTDLGLRPRGGSADYIALTRIEVRDTRVDLAKRAVEVAKVGLAGGEINTWVDPQGKVNLLELMAQKTDAASSAAPASGTPGSGTKGSSATWTVAVPDITVEGLKLSAEDRQVKPAVALMFNPLNVHVTGFTTAPDLNLNITVESTVNDGGKVLANAQVAPRTGVVTAHTELAQLDLTAFQPYITQSTALSLLDGKLGTKLDTQRRADGTIAVKGDARVTGLRTVDNELRQDLVKWKELRVANLQYNASASGPGSLRIGSITAQEPYARVIIAPDRTLNVAEVLRGPKGGGQAEVAAVSDSDSHSDAQAAPVSVRKSKAAGDAAAQPMKLAIGTVRIVNGSANYSDFWIQPNFAVGIQGLNGDVTGLSSDPSSRATVKLEGAVDRYAPVHIDGDLNLLSAALYTDIKLSFKGLELTTMTPYSGRFAGYKIDKGKLSVDVGYKIQNRQLTAEQHFVVDQLQLGERVESPDAVKLPVRLAVALLKDRNGVIDIGLPMSGSLDDPQFRIGPLIWKALVNLLTKAATAPFALLGHLFGGGEEMNRIEFAAGSAELDSTAKERINAVRKALQERPHLQLDVPMAFSPKLDRPSLAAARLHEELSARASEKGRGSKKDPGAAEAALADPAEHFRLLAAQYRADMGKDAPLPQSAQEIEKAKGKKDLSYDAAIAELEAALKEHIEVPDADLQALGKQRAQAIQGALSGDGGIDASRVFVINAKEDSGDKSDADEKKEGDKQEGDKGRLRR